MDDLAGLLKLGPGERLPATNPRIHKLQRSQSRYMIEGFNISEYDEQYE